jgi:hypothetical protein
MIPRFSPRLGAPRGQKLVADVGGRQAADAQAVEGKLAHGFALQ